MPRARSSPVRGGRGKKQRLNILDPLGQSQSGVLASPPAGISPPANQGKQERAAAAGKKPGILQQAKEFLPNLLFPKNK
jgi:hypothetical protein